MVSFYRFMHKCTVVCLHQVELTVAMISSRLIIPLEKNLVLVL